MKLSQVIRRLISGDKATGHGALTLRNAVVWVFIALVALFLTNPSGEALSLFDHPLPMPAELGVDPLVP